MHETIAQVAVDAPSVCDSPHKNDDYDDMNSHFEVSSLRYSEKKKNRQPGDADVNGKAHADGDDIPLRIQDKTMDRFGDDPEIAAAFRAAVFAQPGQVVSAVRAMEREIGSRW